MDFEKTFEAFLTEAEAYSTWGRLERADSYLYRFYDVAITFAPNVPLRRAFEDLIRIKDKRRNSSLEEVELDNKFIHELHKTLKYLASASLAEKPAA